MHFSRKNMASHRKNTGRCICDSIHSLIIGNIQFLLRNTNLENTLEHNYKNQYLHTPLESVYKK